MFKTRLFYRDITTYQHSGDYYFALTDIADLIGVDTYSILKFCHSLDPSYNSLLYHFNEYDVPSPIGIKVKLLGHFLIDLTLNNNNRAKQLLQEFVSKNLLNLAQSSNP